jgi:dephospho-CoA kinase
VSVPRRPEPGRTRRRARTLRVGLTGNIGSGKSTVAALLAERGAAVIDADALARAATDDPEVLGRVAATLGPELITAGRLDRRATAERVFADADARRALEAIVHPWVRAAAAAREAALARTDEPPPVVVHDVPLLFENGLDADMDATIVVSAPLEVRVARVQARARAGGSPGLDDEAVRSRDAAQLPLEEKLARATFVIDNGGPLHALPGQVDSVWDALLAMSERARVGDLR